MSNVTKEQFEKLCKQYVLAYREESENVDKLAKKVKRESLQFELNPATIMIELNNFAESGEMFE